MNIQKGAVFSTKASLGDYSGIGIVARIGGRYAIGICIMMGPNCTIYTRNHKISDCTKPMCEQGYAEEKEVIIGDDVWIGGNVILLPGVRIGSHPII